jgi:Ca2+-binding EF-hand superfamily protein
MIRLGLLLCILHAFISNAHDLMQLQDVKTLHDPRIGDARLQQIQLPKEKLVVDGQEEAKLPYVGSVDPQHVRKRFAKLLDMMDIDKNGEITKEELTHWTYALLKKWDHDFSDHEFETGDKNHDNKMSFEELIKQKLSKTPEEMKKMVDAEDYEALNQYEQYLDMEHGFTKYDMDKDGFLDPEEYHLLVHPWEFDFSKDVFIKQKLISYDFNNDGKITAEEYVEDGLGIIKGRRDHDTVMAVFETWDKNGDGFVEGEEIIWGWSYPDRLEDAKSAVEEVWDKSDDNKDGVLTKKEVMKYYKMWSSTRITNMGTLLRVTRHKQHNKQVQQPPKDEF